MISGESVKYQARIIKDNLEKKKVCLLRLEPGRGLEQGVASSVVQVAPVKEY